jgi:hypothetical protein
MSWFTVVITVVVFGVMGGAVGRIALGASDPTEEHPRVLVGVPLGMVGLLAGQQLFTKVLNITGWRQPFVRVLQVYGTPQINLSYGHIAWDLLMGLVGCCVVFGPVSVLCRLAR